LRSWRESLKLDEIVRLASKVELFDEARFSYALIELAQKWIPKPELIEMRNKNPRSPPIVTVLREMVIILIEFTIEMPVAVTFIIN
jgi:hypothetical protein